LDERLAELRATCGCEEESFEVGVWVPRLLELERLDERWTEILEKLAGQNRTDAPFLHEPDWETAFEQAAVYFLFRHLSAALEDGDISSKAAFAALSVEFLRALCAGKAGCTLDDLVEFARMYSSEVEYSEENLAQVFTWLSE
jgi:lysine-N-methylase